MATITTDTFLDGGTARTAGETWSISNGARLIVRTDTRWHANAPASMTGTLGSVTTGSNSGGFSVDGTKVRWIPFNSGSGNVPPIGTSITQGGVSGYLLGVWADYTSAPTAVGASMPSSGFLKFREVTGGVFPSSGAFGGIGANSNGDETAGWIEVVMRTGSLLGIGIGGSGVVAQGEWFYLGSTNGTIGQTFQIPTNGGGANTFALGVEIETAPGSGVFEWYPGVDSSVWLTTNIATDQRAKVVESPGSGLIRIGANSGGTAIGFTPSSGCLVRTPNIFFRQAAAGTDSTNVKPSGTVSARPAVQCLSNVSMSKVSMDWWFGTTTNNCLSIIVNDCVFCDTVYITTVPVVAIDGICIGALSSPNFVPSFLYCSGTVSRATYIRTAATLALSIQYCNSLNFYDITLIAVAATSSGSMLTITGCKDSEIIGLKMIGGGCVLQSLSNFAIKNADYIMRLAGNSTNQNIRAFNITSCSKLLIDGVTFGLNGLIDNCHPFIALFSSGGGNIDCTFRNAGSASSPLSTGTTPALYTAVVVEKTSANSDTGCKYQRLYLSNTRNSVITASSGYGGDEDTLFEYVWGSTSSTFTGSGVYPSLSTVRGVQGSFAATAYPGLDTFFVTSFSSDTGGLIIAQATRISLGNPFVDISITPNPNSGLITTTSFGLATAGDYIIFESPHKIIGYTGFSATNPTISRSSTTNVLVEYQIDTGSGWNGTWKSATGANFSSEIISPSDGFKLKVRAIAAVSNNANTFTSLKILTTTTLSAKTTNLYPLDTVTLSFEGLQPGSELRAYVGTDPATSVEIGGTESVVGSTFSFTHSSSGLDGYIAIFSLGYIPLIIPRTYASVDSTLLISQVVDRNYVNP